MIRAAGGVLERVGPTGTEIAIVYRERYGPEWGLPKGKLEAGEDLEEAAIREVSEETGCEATIRRFAGTTTYSTADGEKSVTYWLMDTTNGDRFEPNDEVKQMLWLPPELAAEQLTHEDERRILRNLYPMSGTSKIRPLKRLFKRGSRRWKRLEAEIAVFREELAYLAETLKGEEKPPPWLTSARRRINEAEVACRDGAIDKGWRMLMAARRMDYWRLEHDEDKTSAAAMLLKEAQKIKPWRKEATEELLTGEPGKVPPLENIYLAARLRDEHYSNRAYVHELLRSFRLTLVGALVMAVAGILLLIGFGLLPVNNSADQFFGLALGATVFGVFGAIFSASLKAPGPTDNASIPEVVTAWQVTFLRIAMGAGAALLMFFLLASPIAEDLLGTMFSDPAPATLYLVGFVAGFSERLVLRVVSHIAEKKG